MYKYFSTYLDNITLFSFALVIPVTYYFSLAKYSCTDLSLIDIVLILFKFDQTLMPIINPFKMSLYIE